ncbi:MAG: hypothetical protein Q8O56_15585 [Solirubrobacteraceae bacterium]|nr:hypothetical protein [Solirubrobacteraceae bacterium]
MPYLGCFEIGERSGATPTFVSVFNDLDNSQTTYTVDTAPMVQALSLGYLRAMKSGNTIGRVAGAGVDAVRPSRGQANPAAAAPRSTCAPQNL